MIFVGFSLSFVGFVGFVGFGVVPDPPGLGLDKDLGTWKPTKPTKPTKLNEKPTKIKPRPTKPTKTKPFHRFGLETLVLLKQNKLFQ